MCGSRWREWKGLIIPTAGMLGLMTTYTTADGRGHSSVRAQAHLAAACAASHEYTEQLRAETRAALAVQQAHAVGCGMTLTETQAHNASIITGWQA